MRIGKLTNQELESIVFRQLPKLSSSTITGSAIGSDCARMVFGQGSLFASTDPITAGGMQSGTLAIHVSCNDVAACGIKPSGILLVIIAPPTASEEDLLEIVQQASKTAEALHVDIVGGHTEVSDAVNRFVVTTTAFGLCDESSRVLLGKALPGDSLIMTKTAGIEGTWIAAMEFSERLSGVLTEAELKTAQGFISQLSVVPEGCVAGIELQIPGTVSNDLVPAVHLMHDITEGGVFGAAYEMAELSGTGIELFESEIPVHPITAKLSKALGIDPMRFISSGSMLIATSEPDLVVQRLEEQNIGCSVIGRFMDGVFRVRKEDGQTEQLDPPKVDELYKLYT